MSNMNFGVNILPSATDTYSLGNTNKKWQINASSLNGKDPDSFAAKERYTFSIPTTGWTQYGNTDLYTITITVNGVTASTDGMLGIVQSGTESTDADIRDAYGKITRAVTGANAVTLYALEVPEITIPAQLVVFA